MTALAAASPTAPGKKFKAVKGSWPPPPLTSPLPLPDDVAATAPNWEAVLALLRKVRGWVVVIRFANMIRSRSSDHLSSTHLT